MSVACAPWSILFSHLFFNIENVQKITWFIIFKMFTISFERGDFLFLVDGDFLIRSRFFL